MLNYEVIGNLIGSLLKFVPLVAILFVFYDIGNTKKKKHDKEVTELKEQLNKALLLLDQVQDITNRLDDLEHNNKEYHKKE